MLEVQQLICEHFTANIELKAASAKGGYDEIYNAIKDGQVFGVVRINSDFKADKDPIGQWDPGIPLNSTERLDYEWYAYKKLFPANLSPEPLWRNDTAIMCSWVDAERASERLIKDRKCFWTLAEKIFGAVATMHSLGVVHLDMNLGNILVKSDNFEITIIDFEFGPADWVSPSQQRAFDYLRLIDDFIKPRRGGKQMLADIERLVDILDKLVQPEDRCAELSVFLQKLKRLQSQKDLSKSLCRIFPNLEPR